MKEKKEKIMALWVQRSLKEVPSALAEETLALRNSLPIYIDHLSEALATNRKMDVRSLLAHDREAARIGRLHGADRAGNSNYVLTEVIFEYHILREVIFQALEENGPLDSIQRDIIFDSIEQAVNDAAVKFSEVHADIQKKFIDTLTHDLKTPLTSAKLAAQMIQRRPEKPEVCARSAGHIVSGLSRLESMIHNLLDASRLRAGESLTLAVEPCDLSGIVSEVVGDLLPSYGDRLRLESETPVDGRYNADGIRRALENLIGNAVKYGSEKTPITVALKRKKPGLVELSVHNLGSVIPEEQIPYLFENFGRSESAEAGPQKGWGLGLTVVRGVAGAHKGKLRVESSQERGTTFIMELPSA